jgi:glycosyltransferase involved in cell wall biosynthesis
MKILIGIPMLYNAHVIRECLDSIVSRPNIDVLCFDNGADQDVKDVIEEYKRNYAIMSMSVPQNIFVNPAWNRILEVFIAQTDYTHCVLLNSDIIMNTSWSNILPKLLDLYPNDIILPVVTTNKLLVHDRISSDLTEDNPITRVFEGTPGVFICLNREQALVAYPIPEQIKVWYGDEYIYTLLRNIGYATLISDKLVAFHHGSETLKRVEGISEILEADKQAWTNLVEPIMKEKIKLHKLKVGL